MFAIVCEEFGEGVTNVNVGDRVMTFSQQMGGFAEQAVVNAHNLIPLHDDIPFVDAANLLCAHGTAHHGLKQRANLQPGDGTRAN